MRHPAPRSRGLRIGVVLGDTLIAEQVLEHGAFTIGRKVSCSVPLPLPGLPARWELLTLDGRGPRLRLAADMDVRLADGTTVKNRADLGGAADGAVIEVAIPRDGRGKVTMGEIKVMFHELQLAPRRPLPSLPRELRATLADRVDRRLVAFAAASLALHVGVMGAARLNDPPEDLSQAEQALADYVAETTVIDADDLPSFELPKPDPDPTTTVAKPPAPAVATPTVKRPTGDRPAADHVGRPSAPIDAAADATRTADELFGDDSGRLADPTARRRPSGDLGKQLEELRARQASASLVPSSDRELPQRTGPRIGTSEGPPGPDIGDIKHVGPPKTEPDGGRVTLTPLPKPGPDDFPLDAIANKIRGAYLPGLARCYKKSMAENGPMSGKIVLAFEVTERGGVSGASATGVDSGLESCVESLMKGWRFTPVLDGDGDPTDVDVKLTLQLRPD